MDDFVPFGLAASQASAVREFPVGAQAVVPVVYVIDPNSADAESLCAIARRIGAAPQILDSVDSLLASELVERSCIVADMILPDGDGIDLLKRLRARQRSVPVVFVTADRDVRHAVAALRAGAVDYLIKPVLEVRLSARLRKILSIDASN